MDAYTPTNRLRLKMDAEYPDDDTRRLTFRLQQLWVSAFTDEEPEWRDVDLVDDKDNRVSHIAAAVLFGRTA
jgi:hypothetical protein